MSDKKIPDALYSCLHCAGEMSWPATDLWWSEIEKGWVCDPCWHDRECVVDEVVGVSMVEEIKRQALCEQHKQFPCKPCGTVHYEGCRCKYCSDTTTRVQELERYNLGLATEVQNLKLQSAGRLREAAELIGFWGSYASQYAQDKHDLMGSIDAFLTWAEELRGE